MFLSRTQLSLEANSLGQIQLPTILLYGRCLSFAKWRPMAWHLQFIVKTSGQGTCNLLQKGTKKQVGNRSRTLFWHDSWISEVALKFSLPRLFWIAASPLGSIASMRTWNNGVWVWEVLWSRRLRSMDQLECNSLSYLLSQFTSRDDHQDRLIWSLHKSGSFSVHSFYIEDLFPNFHIN